MSCLSNQYALELERKFGGDSTNMDTICRDCGIAYANHFALRCPVCPLCGEPSPSDEPHEDCITNNQYQSSIQHEQHYDKNI